MCFDESEESKSCPRWGVQFIGLDGQGTHIAQKLLPSSLLLKKPGGSLAQAVARAQMVAQIESSLFRAMLYCDGIQLRYMQIREEDKPRIIRA
jgi:hypothetical protein